MLRNARTIVASAALSAVALLALAANALAMPAYESHATDGGASTLQTAADHGSGGHTAVWIVGGAIVLALCALAASVTYRTATLRAARG